MAEASIAIVIVCFVIEFRRKNFSWLAIYAPLLIFQPAWRLAWGEIKLHGLRPPSADCDFGNRGESIFLTATLLAVLLALVRGGVSKRLFLLGLTIFCWLFNVLVLPLDVYALLNWLPPKVGFTIAAGAGHIISYTFALMFVSGFLYILEHFRRRAQRRVQQGS